MLRDFAVFLRALWREWKTLLTGGSIVALIALWELTGHKAFPNSVNWLILGFTFVVAAFLLMERGMDHLWERSYRG